MPTKKRTAKTPSTKRAEDGAIEVQPSGRADAPAERTDAVKITMGLANAFETITIQLPVGPANPAGYLPRKVETRLDQASDQPLALRRLLEGMQAQHEQLDSGKHVDTYAECVRRIIELVAQHCRG